MNPFSILGLLLTAVYLAVAAVVPEYTGLSPGVAKRIESTFAWREYFVRNCTTPCLSASSDGNNTINGDDCKSLSVWQSSNNGGYYELWDFNHFNNFTYRPIVGHDTCVIALSHVVSDMPNDYAVMGSLDVIDLVARVLSQFQLDGKLPTIFGDFVCGPNHTPLNILIYNGRSGWQGTPTIGNGAATSSATPDFTAVPTAMNGPAILGGYATGSGPPLPGVTITPAGTQGGT